MSTPATWARQAKREFVRLPLEERFWKHVNKNAPNGCWEWTSIHNELGYGYVSVDGRRLRAHRVVILLTTGKMPEPHEQVCHRCDNPPCVNPAHLFIGTNLDNVRDMVRKGRNYQGDYNKVKTHCPRGHEYNEANTYTSSKGSRSCRECARVVRAEKGMKPYSATSCRNGHERTEANTYVSPNTGQRSCRECKRDRARRIRGGAS